MDKQTFYARPGIRNLPAKEQKKRYAQHLVSKRQSKAVKSRGRTRNTKLRATNTPVGAVASLHLSKCAQEYFLALQAPFSHKGVACIPDLHAVPSKKVRLKTRGVFSTGQDGNGFCIVDCWANASNTACITASAATLISSTAPLGAFSPNTITISQDKLPYAVADFPASGQPPSTGVQARTVGVGLRIRYIGAELARSGQITAVRPPDNTSLIGVSYQQMKSYSTAKTYRNDRHWTYLMYRPVRPQEYEFSVNYSTASAGDPTDPPKEMGFCIEGTTQAAGTPGPAPFEVETIRYVEYIGNIDNVTKSHVDVVGMSHVRNSLNTKSSTTNPHHAVTVSLKQIEDSIGESLPAAVGGGLAYKNLFGAAEDLGAEESPGIMEALSSAAASVAETLGPDALTMAAEIAPFLIP